MTQATSIIILSVGVHLGVTGAIWGLGSAGIERLGRPTSTSNTLVMAPASPTGAMPEPARASPTRRLTPKPRTQSPPRATRPSQIARTEPSTTLDTQESGTGTETGNETGSDDAGLEPSGRCAVPPCPTISAVPDRAEPPAPPDPPQILSPSQLAMLRISGPTQIHPPDETKREMLRDGKSRVLGVVKLCISSSGAVTSATMVATTKYPAFDQRLLDAVRTWRYRPHDSQGQRVSVCGTVSFDYAMR